LERKIEFNSFRLSRKFTISRGSKQSVNVVTVHLTDGEFSGRGECVPYARYKETQEGVANQISTLPADFTQDSLQTFRAKKEGKRIWETLGLQKPKPVITAFTISLDTPAQMEKLAALHAHCQLLKIKLGTLDDLPRLEAVRRGAPKSRLIVDANEGWTDEVYKDFAPHLLRLGVEMVEQPLPAEQDELLAEIERPVPVCADESCHDRSSLPALKGKYDYINIKLDKTGGLTEALALKKAAVEQGFEIMIGCMVSSSLAIAPATILMNDAAFVDLDGPLLLAEDRTVALEFDNQEIHPPKVDLWG